MIQNHAKRENSSVGHKCTKALAEGEIPVATARKPVVRKKRIIEPSQRAVSPQPAKRENSSARHECTEALAEGGISVATVRKPVVSEKRILSPRRGRYPHGHGTKLVTRNTYPEIRPQESQQFPQIRAAQFSKYFRGRGNANAQVELNHALRVMTE